MVEDRRVGRDKDGEIIEGSDMICGGTMCEAIILASQIDSMNRHVQHIKDNGIMPTVRFDPQTPADVCLWYKNVGNEFHEGSRYSVFEYFREVPVALKGWKAHCVECNIKYEYCPSTRPAQI